MALSVDCQLWTHSTSKETNQNEDLRICNTPEDFMFLFECQDDEND